MSVVGPRSERPFFVEQFEKDIPGYHQRFRVKAGITGFAQVAGSYDTLPEDKLRYDLIYIKNYSILLDLRLVLETVKVVFSTSLYNRTFEKNRTEFTTNGRKEGGSGTP
jgi:lipopolysaccharide/colanic/teichoic acid biosynthesis glycosyltransferase